VDDEKHPSAVWTAMTLEALKRTAAAAKDKERIDFIVKDGDVWWPWPLEDGAGPLEVCVQRLSTRSPGRIDL
jgi:hypothetical protein